MPLLQLCITVKVFKRNGNKTQILSLLETNARIKLNDKIKKSPLHSNPSRKLFRERDNVSFGL